MVTVTEADTFNGLRGYDDWFTLSEGEKSTGLYRAGDYIGAHYPRIRAPANDVEQRVLDTALYMLARDLARNPETLRATPAVKKESKEIAGLKKSVEYADADTLDPYPQVTRLLSSLQPTVIATTTGGGFYSGRQAV